MPDYFKGTRSIDILENLFLVALAEFGHSLYIEREVVYIAVLICWWWLEVSNLLPDSSSQYRFEGRYIKWEGAGNWKEILLRGLFFHLRIWRKQNLYLAFLISVQTLVLAFAVHVMRGALAGGFASNVQWHNEILVSDLCA